MKTPHDQTTQIQALIDRLTEGDASARTELFNCTWERLLRLTRHIARDFPPVRRWEQTEDIFQNASIRIWKALEKVPLQNARHFLRLAAEKIRFELIDLARHYQGPLGQGHNHQTQVAQEETASPRPFEHADDGADPSLAAQWTDVHAQVHRLPEELKEVFDLLWYHDLKQQEVATLLHVDVRTIKRRWRQARLQLQTMLNDLPSQQE
ncbi:MAG: sigma-70 family RNA polymerase sigma factor [Verrucomicrobiota bacterium]|nr:sigma-70 family RNA polymerase sigma factor [Verrucomicrobiota bacterium]